MRFALLLLLAASSSLAAPRRPEPPEVAAAQRVQHASDQQTHRKKAPRKRRAGPVALKQMQAHLQTLHPREHVKHSFEYFGDQVDCVDVLHQASLRAKGMEGHALHAPPTPPAPPSRPAGTSKFADKLRPKKLSFVLKGDQDAQGKLRGCPPGTIPVRRPSIDELSSFRTLRDFFKKHPRHLKAKNTRRRPALQKPEDDSGSAQGPNSLHQYAHARHEVKNYGAHTVVSLWNPLVTEGDSEFSLAQIWVVRGKDKGLQTLEVGVQEFPDKYGDHQTRLFVYSTSDGYSGNNAASGCYNLDCGRFVQTNEKVVVGGPFPAYSVQQGEQHDIELVFLKKDDAWWVKVGDEWLGYYPVSLYDDAGLLDHADVVDFGGEIIDDRKGHPEHTTTAMGSGAYPPAGAGQAAYHRQIYYYDSEATSQEPGTLALDVTDPHCYDISKPASDADWGTHFFFGGPGYNSLCQ